MSIRINVRHIAAWALRCQLVIAGIPCDPLSCCSLIPLLYTHTPLCILPSTCYLWIWAQVAISYLSRLNKTLTFNVAKAAQQAWGATLYSSVTRTQYVKAISFDSFSSCLILKVTHDMSHEANPYKPTQTSPTNQPTQRRVTGHNVISMLLIMSGWVRHFAMSIGRGSIPQLPEVIDVADMFCPGCGLQMLQDPVWRYSFLDSGNGKDLMSYDMRRIHITNTNVSQKSTNS